MAKEELWKLYYLVFWGWIVFGIVGFLLFVYGLSEIIAEIKFKNKAIKTIGAVIGRLPSKYGVRAYDYGGGTRHTTESSAGNILRLTYKAENGDVYQTKTRRVITGEPQQLEVAYDPESPSEVMINGFYQVGREKYIYTFIGAAWILFSLLLAIE